MTARLHSLRHQEKKSAGSSHRQHHQHQQAVHQGPSPAPSPSPSLSPSPKHSDGRRANKPLMEKRRRARINQSLAALKALILDSARLENTKHSKLEKADILELTVRHLQRQRSLAQPGLSRYKAGYQDCSREVSRYLDAPDIITGNTTPMDPAVKQRLLRHLDSCVSELDLDLGSRPDSGLGSSPGSVTDRVAGTTSPGPLDHHVPVGPHCSAALTPAGLIKSEIPEMVEAARPDSSTTAGDENNNSSRPTSAFSQVNPATLDPHHPHHPSGLPVDQASTSQQNPNMLSVVQVIPSRLPDGQVVFLLPSHYVQLAAANMSLLKATDKLAKRPHEEIGQEWQDPTGLKPSKSPRMEQPEQPLDFTTTSKKIKTAGSRNSAHSGVVDHHHHLRQQQQQQQQARLPTETGGPIIHEDRPSSHADSEVAVGMPSPSPVGQQPVKDEEGMWRPW
ncbi:PREDICTED: protein hairy [Acromyrmex echinatior]|uniref:Transcription factor HES-4 n=1 Tax=Acromyrmex echinatior TaxID=103372 RepID=F4WWG7_ACREC|nr:PREDICTED: protein hairy [Acromyrmex echinatior]EGI61509.1 Transcription factor HES-4 [Acromyrmex echinatior]